MFKAATRKQLKLRMALSGLSGVGKTYTALAIASGLGERIAVLDTEAGSASIYSDKFKFDVAELESFSPDKFIEAIKAAEAANYDVLVIDSLSAEWAGKDGALEMVDAASKASGKKDSFNAWRTVTPAHDRLMEAIIRSKCHVICTLRSKAAYEVEKDDRGKASPRKVGLAPIQREGVDFLMTVAGELDHAHDLVISKSRCSALAGKVINKPGKELGQQLLQWLQEGEAPPTLSEAGKALEAKVLTAQSVADLEKLLPELKAIAKVDADLLRPTYTKRKTELGGKAA